MSRHSDQTHHPPLAEPMTVTTLGILILGEKLNPAAVFEIGLIFAGLLILVVKGRSKPRELTT